MVVDNPKNNTFKTGKILSNFIMLMLVISLVILFFFEERMQHYYYTIKNGHVITNDNSVQLNKKIFSIVREGEKFTLLKLNGFSIEEMNVGLIKLKGKLTEHSQDLDEDRILLSNNNCLALSLVSDYYGSYKFVIQHLESKYMFLFESVINGKLIENICNNGLTPLN